MVTISCERDDLRGVKREHERRGDARRAERELAGSDARRAERELAGSGEVRLSKEGAG